MNDNFNSGRMTNITPLSIDGLTPGIQLQDYIEGINQDSQNLKRQKQKFSAEEDQVLLQLHEQYGNDWKLIAAIMRNRTPRQCRDRYKNYLSPTITKNPWTTQDDILLYQKFKEFGRQWAIIAKYFPGRTDIHIKNRWTTISKHFENQEEENAGNQNEVPTVPTQEADKPEDPPEKITPTAEISVQQINILP